MRPTPRGHRNLPHTADVIIEAWGPDLAACAEEAVAALIETYANARHPAVLAEREVHVPPAHTSPTVQAFPSSQAALLG